jgi:hypothetical protein
MALVRIVCPKCGHSGFAGELPKVMSCCACAHTALFRTGEHVIRGEPDPVSKAKPAPPRRQALILRETRAARRQQKAAAAALRFFLSETDTRVSR